MCQKAEIAVLLFSFCFLSVGRERPVLRSITAISPEECIGWTTAETTLFFHLLLSVLFFFLLCQQSLAKELGF